MYTASVYITKHPLRYGQKFVQYLKSLKIGVLIMYQLALHLVLDGYRELSL